MEACIQFLLLLTAYFQGINAAFELTLVHTNDVHARFEETNTFGGACSITELSDGSCFGGVARRHHLVQTLRNKHSNLLFLDGGDQFQGTLWFNYYKGMAAAHFMNMLQYDVMVSARHTPFPKASVIIQEPPQTKCQFQPVHCSVHCGGSSRAIHWTLNIHALYHQCTPVYNVSVPSVTSGYTALGSVPCISFMTSGNKGYRRKMQLDVDVSPPADIIKINYHLLANRTCL